MMVKTRLGRCGALPLVFLLLTMPGMGLAQQVKIGVVNINQLITESPQAAALLQSLEEEFAPRQRELVAMRDSYQQRREQLQRDVEVMGPEERQNAERDLRKEERQLERSGEEFNEDLNLRRNEELAKLQREILLEVAAYARETGYDLVLGDGVFYASSAVDITPDVLKRLQTSAGASE